jgi:hypothetical protein
VLGAGVPCLFHGCAGLHEPCGLPVVASRSRRSITSSEQLRLIGAVSILARRDGRLQETVPDTAIGVVAVDARPSTTRRRRRSPWRTDRSCRSTLGRTRRCSSTHNQRRSLRIGWRLVGGWREWHPLFSTTDRAPINERPCLFARIRGVSATLIANKRACRHILNLFAVRH